MGTSYEYTLKLLHKTEYLDWPSPNNGNKDKLSLIYVSAAAKHTVNNCYYIPVAA